MFHFLDLMFHIFLFFLLISTNYGLDIFLFVSPQFFIYIYIYSDWICLNESPRWRNQ